MEGCLMVILAIALVFGIVCLEAWVGMLLFNFLGRPDFVSYENETKESFGRKMCTLLGALPVGWTFKKQCDMQEIFEKIKEFDKYHELELDENNLF